MKIAANVEGLPNWMKEKRRPDLFNMATNVVNIFSG